MHREETEGMRIWKDLAYTEVAGRELHLDLYVPKREETGQALSPLVIWIHGGAWREGSKENPRGLRFVKRGYGLASINYRLSQEARFPAQLQDCKNAVRWLQAHAEGYGLDPTRIAVWGGSAGAYLASMIGVTMGLPASDGGLDPLGSPVSVRAVCAWYGPTDFLRMDDRPGAMVHLAPDSPESQFLGAQITQRPDLVALANPITYLTRDRAPALPPFLLIHGTADDVVLPSQSRMFDQALSEVGADSTLILLDGLNHGFVGDHERWDEIWSAMDGFFDRELRSEPD